MTLPSKSPRYILRKLWVGARLRCPECEIGPVFDGHLHVSETCPYCNVRYERGAGEAIGGIYVTVVVAESTAFLGFLIVHALFSLSIVQQLMFWVPYLVVFSMLFYRHARAIWISVLYLTGAVYRDPDYTREYFGPTSRLAQRNRREDESV